MDRSEPSELISQAQLDLPRGIQDAVTVSAGNPECRASDIAIYSAERVAVERVRNIQLENEGMGFKKRSSFDD